MGFLGKLKRTEKSIDWDNAYVAKAKFYGKPDGTPFGAIALTEGTETVLPKAPQTQYAVDGKPVSEWKMVFVSTSKDSIIGDADYFTALAKIKAFVIDTKVDSILVKGLSLPELESLMT